MNVDDALAVARHGWPAELAGLPVGEHTAVTALRVLAAWVRDHRPVMPMAQRGRTVDHAVEVHQLDGAPVLVSLCGHVKPAELPADDTAPDLPAFDPLAGDACVSCCRRLPAELRPELPPRPPRDRQHDALTDYVLQPGAADSPDVVLLRVNPPAELARLDSPELAELVRIARSDARRPA